MNPTQSKGMNNLISSEFYLSQNYPNPFSEKTTIKFCVACKAKVKLQVFDSESKLVRTLLDEEKEAGTYEVESSARGGSPPAIESQKERAGAFILSERFFVFKLQAGNFLATKKMLLLNRSSI